MKTIRTNLLEVGGPWTPLGSWFVRFPAIFSFVLILLISSVGSTRTILRNDSAEVGDMIAFYEQLQGTDAFTSIFDVPDEYEAFQVCRLLVWIGPAGFNVFTLRIAEADESGDEIFEPAPDGSNGVNYSDYSGRATLTPTNFLGVRMN